MNPSVDPVPSSDSADTPQPPGQPAGLVSRMAGRVRENRVLARHDRLRGLLRGVYRAGVLAATRGRGPFVTVNGRDRFRFVNHFSPLLDWEPELHDAMDRLVKPGMTVLDVGANCGTFTMIMAARVGGGETSASGRVFAFEPAPDCRSALERNCRNNGFGDRVRVVPCLIGDGEGEADLHWVRGRNSLVNSLFPDVGSLHGHESVRITLPMTTLDAYLSREGVRPDLIKIDIEGAEWLALEGGRETFSSPEAPVLLLEIHPAPLEARGVRPADVTARLRGFGYRVLELDGSPLDEIGVRMQILAVK